MHRTRIKFCGITSPEDAVAAASAGADAIGLVFSDRSKRHVSHEQAAIILRSLRPMITPVALFVDLPPSQVRQVAMDLHIRTVQLHGHEPPESLAELKDLSVIKAVQCDAEHLGTKLEKWNVAAKQFGNLSGLLLETPNLAQAGGSGIENDWAGIESVLTFRANNLPLIAAGGLNPENVAQVIQKLRPWGVDVSSGIEERPGIKSFEKMLKFSQAVRSANEREVKSAE